MPIFELSTSINKPAQKVFDTIKDMERFSEFMRDVKKVTIVKRSKDSITTKWHIDVDGTQIEWMEEDHIDVAAQSIAFKTIKGNYKYDGKWQVISLGPSNTKLSIHVVFDWEVPNFEQFFGHVYEKKARLSLKGMLNAVRRRVQNG